MNLRLFWKNDEDVSKPNKQGVWVAVRNANNLTAYDLVADKGTETNVKKPILSVHSSQGNKLETV